MTDKEMSRLCDWLSAKGYTPEKINECIKYIANKKLTALNKNSNA